MHEIKIRKRLVTSTQHGYQCSCGESIIAESMRQARELHQLFIAKKKIEEKAK